MSSILTRLKNFFVEQKKEIADVITPFEHDFLSHAHSLIKQIEANGGQQLLTLAKTALTDALVVVGTGNWGAAIAEAAPKLIATLFGDITADGKNAVYGALSIAQAELQAVPVANPAAGA